MNSDSISQYRRDQSHHYSPIHSGGQIARSGLDSLPQDVLEDLGRGDLDSVKAKLDLLHAKKNKGYLPKNNSFSKFIDNAVNRLSKLLTNIIQQMTKKGVPKKGIKKGEGASLEEALARLQTMKMMEKPQVSPDTSKLKDLISALILPGTFVSKLLISLLSQMGKQGKDLVNEALAKVLQAGTKAMVPFKKTVDHTLAIITAVVSPPYHFCKETAERIRKKFQEGSEKLNQITQVVLNGIIDQVKTPLEKLKEVWKHQKGKISEFADTNTQKSIQIVHQIGTMIGGIVIPISINTYQNLFNFGMKIARKGSKNTGSIGKKLKDWGRPFASFAYKMAHICANGAVEAVHKTAFILSWLMHKLLVLLTLFALWIKKHMRHTWSTVKTTSQGLYFWVPELTKVIGIILFKGLTLLPVTLFRLIFRRS